MYWEGRWTLSQTMMGRFLLVMIMRGRYIGCIMGSRLTGKIENRKAEMYYIGFELYVWGMVTAKWRVYARYAIESRRIFFKILSSSKNTLGLIY